MNMTTRQEILSLLQEIKDHNHSSQNKKTCDEYKLYYFHKYLRSNESQQWNKEIIFHFLKKAFSKGFHGIHFVSVIYEPCMDLILEKYFGADHYLGYRVCQKHDKIVLTPNYEKLKIDPNSYLIPSFVSDVNLKYPFVHETYADFCFE